MFRPLATTGGIALASFFFASTAFAQTPDTPREGEASADREALREELRRELTEDFEQRLQRLREEMRDEAREAAASASAGDTWDEEWDDVRPQLEFLELDGYFRTRMDVFDNFDLNTGTDASGFHFFPVDPRDPDADTVAGANMRFRIDPTLNVSEEIRLRAQIDVFDNLVFGATPRAGISAGMVQGNQRYPYAFLGDGQDVPRHGFNAVSDSIEVKRAWAEIRTPVGELRFGRMPTHFGLGMNVNDGNCIDCDHGDTVDRIMFATRIADHVIAPAIDFVSEGPTSADPFVSYPTAQPFDRSQADDARDYVLMVLRRDDDEQIRRMRQAGRETFFHYGAYLTYREQSWDASTLQVGGPGHGNAGGGAILNQVADPEGAFAPRDAQSFSPDLWFRLLHKKWRLEFEIAAVYGRIENRALLAGADVEESQTLDLQQYGAVLQNEVKLADDKLTLGLEIGFASGDDAPGFGNFPGRAGTAGASRRGDWDGPQYDCTAAACADNDINNFRFDRDYRVDLILFREILGGVTDATYIKPSVNYDITEGLGANLGIIYSMVNSTGTVPTRDRPLGLEIDASVNYLSDDGFVASLAYGVLFPLSGLDQLQSFANPGAGVRDAGTAQAVRGYFGVVF